MNFISEGWAFVPERAQQWAILIKLIPVGIELRLTELCCGDGEFAQVLLEARPNVSVQALDSDEKMLQAARERLSRFTGRASVERFDLMDDKRPLIIRSSDIVLSSLGVHHLSDAAKKTLFYNVWQALWPGGEFILADILEPCTGLGWDIAAWAWDESVKAQSLARLGNLTAFQKFCGLHWNMFTDPEVNSIDKPSSLWDQMCWLSTVGFERIEVHWVKAGHFVLSARRPGAFWPTDRANAYASQSPARPND